MNECQNPWRPIESAPKNGSPILAVKDYGFGREPTYEVVRWKDDGWWFADDEYSLDADYWMPFPAFHTKEAADK